MNAPRKTPARNGYQYRQQFGVIVICKTEIHQAKIYNQLKRQGHQVRVVTV